MCSIINVFIQNGNAGVWLALPTNRDDFQKSMSEIGASDANSITISQYEVKEAELPETLLMNANLNQVNYLSARLSAMSEKQLDKLNAIMESPMRFTTIEQIIEYTYNTDYFLFVPGIHNTVELARYDIYDTGLCQMPEEWKGGIDLEKFGAHVIRQEQGVFTSKGYLTRTGDTWKNVLAGRDIPGEYRLI